MYIKVIVKTKAKKESVVPDHDKYKVSVKAPPEEGKANKRVLELLRDYFGTHLKVIRIVSGHHSDHKTILCEEVTK